MKIAILGSAYPLRGGLASYNERLAKQFQEEGHEVKIFTFSLQYPSVFFPGKTQLSESPPPECLDIEVCLNSINPFSWLGTFLKIQAFKADLLVMKFWLPFMGPCLGSIAYLVRFFSKTKVVTIVDNMIPHESRTGDYWLSKYFVGSCNAFIAMSDSVLDDIKSFTNKLLRLHPHPLFDNFGQKCTKEEACKKLGLNSKFDYMLFFGFIRDYKGLDLLMEACALMETEFPKLKLLVAGEFYSNEEHYKKLEKSFDLGNRLIWHDHFISDEMVRYYFSLADLVVQPYKTATQSGVTQIAYHFEKPMIVTRVGGLPELVPHGKVGYVSDLDPLDIKESIMRFYNEADHKKMLQNIKEFKKAFSWASMSSTILDIYKELH